MNRLSTLFDVKFSHLPTLMVVVGYPLYWLELYFFDTQEGRTSPLAFLLFLLGCMLIIIRKREVVVLFIKKVKTSFLVSGSIGQWYVVIGGIFVAFILGCAFYASLLPPHLHQEYDALNYHLTIPRQHLIVQSFKHIEWSSADLFLLPIQFSLAPYWFVTEFPNKFPQFLFFVGVVMVSVRLVSFFVKDRMLPLGLIALAILGSHGIGIQMGTAMLDLTVTYLLLAAWDSFLRGNWRMATVEFTFFFWSKPFIPIQILFILGGMLFLVLCFKLAKRPTLGWVFGDVFSEQMKREYAYNLKKMICGIVLVSFVVAGPFLTKSMCYAGTPLYPFVPGFFVTNEDIRENSQHWQSVVKASEVHLETRDAYGDGRSPVAALKHLLNIAVPESGVNNKFDYPLGLPYLLFWGPFVWFLFGAIRKKVYCIVPIFVVLFWFSWWCGSQQSRFLYIPLILMYVSVLSTWKIPSSVFAGTLIVSVMLSALSVYRAHRYSFFTPREMVLRDKDLHLVRMSEDYKKSGLSKTVALPYHDVAYARFPVMVTKEKPPYVILPRMI